MPEKKPLSKNLVTRECTGCDKKCPAILLECWNVAAAWQKEFPQEDGAWWFFGVIPQETDKTLTIMVVRKTVNVPPQSFAFWNIFDMES